MSDYTVREILPEWDGTERRGIDGMTLQLMAEVRKTMETHEKAEKDKFDEIKKVMTENRVASEERHSELTTRFDGMQQSTMTLLQTNNQTVNEIHKLFKLAFPEGDAAGHRKAHEAWIEKERQDKEFWVKLKQHVINWAVLAVVGWGGIGLWALLLQGPK